MQVKQLSPFGVRVADVDVNSTEHQARIRKLLWEHSVVILPSGAAAPGAAPVHDDESLTTLGRLFGKTEDFHPVKPNKSSIDVQASSTGGDSGSHPDSFLYHADLSWRVNPARATVSCGVLLPPSGGNICFQSTKKMYERLSPDLKEKLLSSSFVHSLQHGYSKVNRAKDVKTEMASTHPGVIKHPTTGAPLLYVNETFAKSCEGMSEDESKEFLRSIFAEAYIDENALTHEWGTNDVVIWDNLGTQHLEKADYEELRTMHEVVSGDTRLRLERFAAEDSNEKRGLENVVLLLQAQENAAAYTKFSTRYDQDVAAAGYIVPIYATNLLAKHLKTASPTSDPLILDVAAGTGQNALLFMQKYGLTNIEAVDLTEAMLFEARRRNLYKEYRVANANEPLSLSSGTYDGALCAGGFAPNQINPSPGISEMVRVTKKGGFVVVTFRETSEGYEEEVNRLIAEGFVTVVEKERFVGVKSSPNTFHVAFVLQVS